MGDLRGAAVGEVLPGARTDEEVLELESLKRTDKMMVDEYYATFTALLHLLPGVGYHDEILVERFYGGLSHRIRYGLGAATFTTVQVKRGKTG